jgi:hypothetical protein
MQRLSLPPNAQWCSGVASVLPWYSHNLSETWKPVYRNFIGWLPFNGILYCTRYPVPSSAHFILSDLQRRWCSATTRQQNQESLCHIHLGWPDLKRGVPVLRFRMVPWTEPNPFQSTKPWQCKWIVRSMYFIWGQHCHEQKGKQCQNDSKSALHISVYSISASMRAIQAIQGSILDRTVDIIEPSPTLGILWHPASLQLWSEPGWP